jgi:beta-1,4-mannosyl-glycoprotein beta-1,4-N-acetylglucosaminyltransferase
MKIIDCFTFYNELSMLKCRLKYLYDTVDHFVLVEATRTHAGNPKSLYFQNNKHLFEPYLDKIVHVVVDDMPMPRKRMLWQGKDTIDYHILRENHQRICIARGIQQLSLSNDDLILISDLDEIPNKDILRNELPSDVCKLSQELYYYNFTCKNKQLWTQARILKYSAYIKTQHCQNIRMLQNLPIIKNGGWHLSYFGDADFIANKLRNFCHKEFSGERFTNKLSIQEKIDNGLDLFDHQSTNDEWVRVEADCPISPFFE